MVPVNDFVEAVVRLGSGVEAVEAVVAGGAGVVFVFGSTVLNGGTQSSAVEHSGLPEREQVLCVEMRNYKKCAHVC